MPKYTERIALEQFNYLEIEAASLNEIQAAAQEARTLYAERLHKPQQNATSQATSPFPSNAPLPIDRNGTNCDTCQSVMSYREGEKNGKPWRGYFCPNSQKGASGHSPKWIK